MLLEYISNRGKVRGQVYFTTKVDDAYEDQQIQRGELKRKQKIAKLCR